jgi:hypothetical protein
MRRSVRHSEASSAFIILLVCPLTIAIRPAVSLAAAQVCEDFDSDPGWDSRNNHIVPATPRTVVQDFGYRSSNHAGSAAGEIGGIIDRSPLQGAYYGKVLSPLNLEQPLSFSGQVALLKAAHTVGYVSSSDVYVGFFNSREQGWRPRDFLGFRLCGNNDPSPNVASLELSYGTSAWTADATSGVTTILPNDEKHSFQLNYNPSIGNGQITFSWDGGPIRTLNLRPPHRSQGAVFNRFGIFSNQLPGVVEGNRMEAYFDDLTVNGQFHDFAVNPGWEGVGNQATFQDSRLYGTNDFGFRSTSHAGGAPGELGGLIWRVEDSEEDLQAYYADNVGTLTLDDHLSASGRIAAERFSVDSGVMLGWFNSGEQDWPPSNFVGVYMDSLTDTGRYFTPMYGTGVGTTGFANEPWLLLQPDGTSKDWTIDYDPAAYQGRGAITVTLGGVSRTLVLYPGEKAEGAVLDRFGLFNMQDNNGKHSIIHLDDLCYTSARLEMSPVSGVTAQRFASSVQLSWTNPAAADFVGTTLRFKTTGYPSGPSDGTLLADKGNAPGTADTYRHTGLIRGTYYYALFAYDVASHYASPALVTVPILPGDFDNDGDIDQCDFGHLQHCVSGTGAAYIATCEDADLDTDGDVDGSDVSAFLPCLGGEDNPPGC